MFNKTNEKIEELLNEKIEELNKRYQKRMDDAKTIQENIKELERLKKCNG